MANILNLVRTETAFDPETIAVLSAALDEAWDRLLQSGSEGTRPAYARAMREVVARRIIDMAQRGTKHQKELVEGAVRFLAASYRLEARRPQIFSERLSRRRRFPSLRLRAVDKARPCRKGLLEMS
jgi:hypothetical protein